jgi:hypothetical protein
MAEIIMLVVGDRLQEAVDSLEPLKQAAVPLLCPTNTQ